MIFLRKIHKFLTKALTRENACFPSYISSITFQRILQTAGKILIYDVDMYRKMKSNKVLKNKVLFLFDISCFSSYRKNINQTDITCCSNLFCVQTAI